MYSLYIAGSSHTTHAAHWYSTLAPSYVTQTECESAATWQPSRHVTHGLYVCACQCRGSMAPSHVQLLGTLAWPAINHTHICQSIGVWSRRHVFTIEMAKQRHRLESTISDGSVTRSKHMIGNCMSWKTDLQWCACIPVYNSSASTIVGLLYPVCKRHGRKQRNSTGTWTWTDKLRTLLQLTLCTIPGKNTACCTLIMAVARSTAGTTLTVYVTSNYDGAPITIEAAGQGMVSASLFLIYTTWPDPVSDIILPQLTASHSASCINTDDDIVVFFKVSSRALVSVDLFHCACCIKNQW